MPEFGINIIFATDIDARSMIIIDCEKMKYPNTGLFFFCDMLVKAIIEENKGVYDLGFYVPRKYVGRWGETFYYRRKKFVDKIVMFSPAQCQLWHTTFQLAHYVPCNGKVLLTVHDLNFLYEKNEQKQKKYMRKMQQLVDRADRIVAISEYTKQDLLSHINIGDKKVDVIYNGCNVYEGALEEPSDLPTGDFLFTVATVLPKKKFHVLPCLLQGNNFELIIAGNKSDYVNMILDEARKYGVEGRVKIVGPIAEGEKHWYMKHCKAFLFPSIAEGFGLPVIEAMAYGKPVFLSCHTCLPEIGGQCAYYFNKDFDRDLMLQEFNNGLDDFYGDEERKAEKIKQRAAQFSWKNAADSYLNIYREMSVAK